MVRNATSTIDIKSLSKGQIRKLNSLKKSVGDDIGAKAFSTWLKSEIKNPTVKADKNAEAIAQALEPLVKSGKLKVPWSGYLVKRGKSRVIVSRAKK